MKKTTYLESNRDGSIVVAYGYNVTNRLPSEFRTMGPWFARGDARRGWYLTHGPSGMKAGWNDDTLMIAIQTLAARDVETVRRAVGAAFVIPADERARALAVITVEAAE